MCRIDNFVLISILIIQVKVSNLRLNVRRPDVASLQQAERVLDEVESVNISMKVKQNFSSESLNMLL